MNRLTLAISSAYASAITTAMVTVITIWAELSPQFKDTLKSATGHHWRTKSWLTVAIFVISAGVLYAFLKRRAPSPRAAIITMTAAAILGAIAVTGFYVWHY